MKITSSNGIKEIEDLEPGLLRQRRNLLAISLAICIFYLSGGSIGNISTPFGTISVARPNVIIFTVWIFLAYSIWRYWLYSEPSRGAFSKDFSDEIYRSKSYHRFVAGVLLPLQTSGQGSDNKIPLIKWGLFSRTLDFNKAEQSYEVAGPNSRKYLVEHYVNEPILKVSYWKMFPIELRAGLCAMLRCRSFSDHYLPYISSLTAIGIGTSHSLFGVP